MKVLIHPGAIAYHFRAGTGGARAVKNGSKSLDDLRRWNIVKKNLKSGIMLNYSHAIGDILLSTASVEQLRIKYPERNISIHHPYVVDAFTGNPNIDEIAKGQFDAQRTYRVEKSIYSWMAENKWEGHISEAYCRMIDVPVAPSTRPQIFGIEPMENSGPYVVICPQSNAKLFDFSDISRTKYWSNDRWQIIIDYLVEKGYDVIHLTGEEQHDSFDKVVSISNLKFREAFRWISSSSLVVSLDTMGSHVAAAFDVPTVTMFGRTRPEQYGHEGPDRVNLWKPCPIEYKCFNNQPYQQDREQCPLPDHDCMNHSVEEVIEAIEQVLAWARESRPEEPKP
jgi:ADP-heptose:LPS heptosyltransferase